MAKGLSIHVGLNAVDPNHYKDGNGNDWAGVLAACENDARSMKTLAESHGYEALGMLLTGDATTTALAGLMSKAAVTLGIGDTLLLTYSGHGGQVDNINPDSDAEEDELDETWCLFDREFLDDELYALFANFAAGVRVVVLSDSCHSGTVTKGRPETFVDDVPSDGSPLPTAKQLPLDVAVATEERHRELYTAAQTAAGGEMPSSIKCAVALISGCQDEEFSRDGAVNGAFTAALLEALAADEGASLSLRGLHAAASALIPKRFKQHPNYVVLPFDGAPAFTL
jgi:metacaspase-1